MNTEKKQSHPTKESSEKIPEHSDKLEGKESKEKIINSHNSEQETPRKEQLSPILNFIGKPIIVHTEWEDVQFTFPAPKIRFGKGISREVPQAIFELLDPMLPYIKKAEISQPKVLIVTGRSSVNNGAYARIVEACQNNAIESIHYQIPPGEPTVDMLSLIHI